MTGQPHEKRCARCGQWWLTMHICPVQIGQALPLPVLTPSVPFEVTTTDKLTAERDALRVEVERLRSACSRENDIISQTLGRALDYPRFADDQKNFPGATDADGVCVGDHVAASLADEAANVIRTLRAEVERLRADAERYRWIADKQPDIDWISDPDNQIVVWAVSGHGYRGRTLGDALDAARAAQEGKT